MHSDASPAILLLAGIVILALQVRIARRGTFVSSRFNGVTREDSPALFWSIVGVNVLLGVGALAFGVARLLDGR
jgi:hypothetical protein